MNVERSEAAASLTVAGVLDLEEIRSGAPEVVAGEADLDRPIRWVHIADSEHVEQFLEGGELVLTTAQTFRRSPAAMTVFLDQLEAAGAAGVVVELVDDASDPDEQAAEVVRHAASGRELPVVVLTHRIKFVRITEVAHRSLLAEQLGRLERAREIHETYTQLSLERAEVSAIVARTAELLGAPVVLEDVAHRVLAQAGPGAEALVANWVALVSGADAYVRRDWPQIPVGLQSRRWGRLVVPGLPTGAANVEQIIERAAQALTLTRMAETDERDLLLQAQAGFVRELMDVGAEDEAQARARARSLGFEPPGASRLVPAVIRLDRDPSTDPTRMQLWERALIQEATAAAARAGVSTLSTGLQSGSFGLVLALPGRGDESKALHRVFEEIADLGTTWAVGVGRSSSSLLTAVSRLESAAQVAEVASTLDVREQVFYRAGDVRLRGLLALLGDDPRLRGFAEGELGPLLESADEEMLDFLELVLTHGGNKSAVARAGFLSRPALYARLAKLQDRLGVSLDDAESRTALHVALLWWRMNR
ncbi:PucR family transcriptional regulator [Brevibacterium casei]|uniref:PucR family transcriptional regulator n=1 Tax=Brevibacterium casei TaxID=33889 RepID=UPI00344CE70D